MGKKLTAIWRIITSGYSLEDRIRLILHMQEFIDKLNDDLEVLATKKGQLQTMQALRAVAIEKLEQNGRK